MAIKLVATDLDGTLLDSNFKVRQDVKRTADVLLAKGIHLVVVTGRMYSAAVNVLQDLGLDLPIICYNGAMVKTGISGKTLLFTPLERDCALAATGIGLQYGLTTQIYVNDQIYIQAENEHTKYYAEANRIQPVVVPDLLAVLDQGQTAKVLIMGSDEQLAVAKTEILAKVGHQVAFTSSHQYFLDILAKGVNKGSALAKLAANYQVLPTEILAIGDNYNDLPLLQFAGIGVAMGNGVEGLKTQADFVTTNQDEGGWCVAMEKFVLL